MRQPLLTIQFPLNRRCSTSLKSQTTSTTQPQSIIMTRILKSSSIILALSLFSALQAAAAPAPEAKANPEADPAPVPIAFPDPFAEADPMAGSLADLHTSLHELVARFAFSSSFQHCHFVAFELTQRNESVLHII